MEIEPTTKLCSHTLCLCVTSGLTISYIYINKSNHKIISQYITTLYLTLPFLLYIVKNQATDIRKYTIWSLSVFPCPERPDYFFSQYIKTG